MFKARAYPNEIPHTFLSTAHALKGAARRTSSPPSRTPTAGNWNKFDLGYERRDIGGYCEWQKNSPWYFRVDGNQV